MTLKFRLFDKHHNSFVYNNGASLHCVSNWCIDMFTGKILDYVEDIETGIIARTDDHPNKVISLGTGWTDIHGIDIYDGDIVEYQGREYIVTFKSIMEGCVLGSRSGIQLINEMTPDGLVFNRLEIVGNIYIK